MGLIKRNNIKFVAKEVFYVVSVAMAIMSSRMVSMKRGTNSHLKMRVLALCDTRLKLKSV